MVFANFKHVSFKFESCGSQPGAILHTLPLRRYLALPGFIFVCHSGVRNASGSQHPEAWDTAKHATMHRTFSTAKNCLVQSINSAEVEKLNLCFSHMLKGKDRNCLFFTGTSCLKDGSWDLPKNKEVKFQGFKKSMPFKKCEP